MDENESSKGSRTVQRSINIMNCFTMEESELTLTEISNKINLAKSTTSRLIDTLVHNGLLQKNSQIQNTSLATKCINLVVLQKIPSHLI